MEHILERKTVLNAPLEEVFKFFGDASNLQALTPPELGFTILTPTPIDMKQGTLIDYKIKLAGIPMKWQTLISLWEPPHRFIDEQLKGPYKTWIHLHALEPMPDGRTEMLDRVKWALPFAPLGELARPIVKWQLNRIFDYRTQAIKKFFKD